MYNIEIKIKNRSFTKQITRLIVFNLRIVANRVPIRCRVWSYRASSPAAVRDGRRTAIRPDEHKQRPLLNCCHCKHTHPYCPAPIDLFMLGNYSVVFTLDIFRRLIIFIRCVKSGVFIITHVYTVLYLFNFLDTTKLQNPTLKRKMFYFPPVVFFMYIFSPIFMT